MKNNRNIIVAVLLIGLGISAAFYFSKGKAPEDMKAESNLVVEPEESVDATATAQVRGVNYPDFLASVDTPSAKFGPQLWNLWKAKKWTALEKFVKANNLNGLYPPMYGFEGVEIVTLHPGKELDRYGGIWGKYVANKGEPFDERSLQDKSKNDIYYVFKVMKDIPDIMEGLSIPWFGKRGLGIQYKFLDQISNYRNEGYLIVTDSVLPKQTK
jgi:hypothetical protein